MITSPSNSFATALFLIGSMSIAGIFHTIWLHSPLSNRFRQPLDGGRTFRGKRIFGENKMVRGLLVMPLAAMLVFYFAGYFRDKLPTILHTGTWNTTSLHYGITGLIAGLFFMLAELPNSFIKRQLGIIEGKSADKILLKYLFLVIDRIDSSIGTLMAISFLVPLQALTWLWTLLIGTMVHFGFSFLLFLLKIKKRTL